MNLRLLAANLHEWLQRKVRYPFGPDPIGAFHFVYAVVFLAVIGFFFAMALCATPEATVLPTAVH